MFAWHATDYLRNRVSSPAGLHFSASVRRQLAADGESRAGIRQRRRRTASVAGDVRADDVYGQTSTTDSVHRRLRLRQRLVNTTTSRTRVVRTVVELWI